MRNILVMVPDLLFSVKIAGAVRALGGTPVEVTAGTLFDHLAEADLLVVDSGQQGAWADAVRALKAEPAGAAVPVLAFGPHVDVAVQRMAVAVGCDRVVTRGKLAAELPDLIRATARTGQTVEVPTSRDAQLPALPAKGSV